MRNFRFGIVAALVLLSTMALVASAFPPPVIISGNGAAVSETVTNTNATFGIAINATSAGPTLVGQSKFHSGVTGITRNPGFDPGLGVPAAVFGTTDDPRGTIGVLGESTWGSGVNGISQHGTGVLAQTFGTGVIGLYGVASAANSTGVYGQSTFGNGVIAKSFKDVALRIDAGDNGAIVVYNSSGAKIMTLDSQGNLTIAGHIKTAP